MVLDGLLQLCERQPALQKIDKKKLYRLLEPETMCVSKGKAHKRYEFARKFRYQHRIEAPGSWALICAKAIRPTATRRPSRSKQRPELRSQMRRSPRAIAATITAESDDSSCWHEPTEADSHGNEIVVNAAAPRNRKSATRRATTAAAGVS